MSHIQFESATEKERVRQELREVREELLKRAQQKNQRQQEEILQKKFRGEDQWMLPSVSRKIIDSTTEKHRKSKKAKKEHKSKKSRKDKKQKKKKYSNSSSSNDNSDSEEEIIKRKKTEDSTSDSSADEWVEKKTVNKKEHSESVVKNTTVREDWMSGMSLGTFSKIKVDKKKEERKDIDSYDPSKSSRELNPFWKNGGAGLPTFQKPNYDSDEDIKQRTVIRHSQRSSGNWRKNKETNSKEKSKLPERSRSREHKHESLHRKRTHRSRSPKRSRSKSPIPKSKRPSSINQSPNRYKSRSQSREKYGKHRESLSPSKSPSPVLEVKSSLSADRKDFLTDQQMNELGAKIIKAEIMGDDELVDELKIKLEKARVYRNAHKNDIQFKLSSDAPKRKTVAEDVLLTTTNSKGVSRPLQRQTEAPQDPWGGRSGRKNKSKKKVETHVGGERVRYFADDDKYDIKQMFENEKFVTAHDQDEQFVNIAGKHKNPNDDLEELFSDKVRQGISETEQDQKNKNRAIREHQDLAKTLESCIHCFDSLKMEKQLLVAMGTNVYLSLPWHEALQTGHCLIVPMQHVSCSTQLDEDVWDEVLDFQKAITRMFKSRSQDVIFFETVSFLHKRPHMVINCIPNKDFELAPFYFKKAIQESEREWSTNKQLVTLKEKDVRRSIPKGLPYFWVHFGVDNGFAHVIEEQDRFPSNFAQEIIGGLLNLDPRVWRRPRREQNPIPKVKQFADWWKPFDITSN